MDIQISYAGQQISVSKEVADFLERDRRKMAALKKQDERHLSKSDFETVLACHGQNAKKLEDTALKDLSLEKLRIVVYGLSDEEMRLISLRFTGECSLEEIGSHFGVSKMAISKRLKKLFSKLRDSVI